jgi:hypothetical protein
MTANPSTPQSDLPITYPISFLAAVNSIIIQMRGKYNDTFIASHVQTGNETLTGFNISYIDYVSTGYYWIAIGH